MIKKINNCVSCDLPCIGKQCPYSSRMVEVCDECLDAEAEFYAAGKYWCWNCLDTEIKFLFDRMDLEEAAKLFFYDFRPTGG